MNSITCPKCGRTSYHPQDVKAGYCANCHDWTEAIMDRKYRLECKHIDLMHTRFALYDPTGANCGNIIVLTSDARNFISRNWNGNVDWNDKDTEHII